MIIKTLFLLFFLQISLNGNEFDFYDIPMYQGEQTFLKNKVKEMFKHAYLSYKNFGMGADELKPQSCGPVYKKVNVNENRFLANCSLTLVESLGTLITHNLLDEVKYGLDFLEKNLNFNSNLYVSVFETNIRVVGGLLSAHLLLEDLKTKNKLKFEYNGFLLKKSQEIADILCVAFENSPTGLPFVKINLKTKKTSGQHTTIADVGSFIIEFGSLSNYTNNPKYKMYADKALDFIWKKRLTDQHLPYTSINIMTGKWGLGMESLGSCVDSYYEYLIKAYFVFGEEKYLERYEYYYKLIRKRIFGNKGFISHVGYIDHFQAFFPSTQVLYGHVDDAIEYYTHLFKYFGSYLFLPETINLKSKGTKDYSFVLRPEFIESTYYLYKETKDPFYLRVARQYLYSLETKCREKCGFSDLTNFATGQRQDSSETFLFSEVFKYLYLIFEEEEELLFDINDYAFSTEAHLFPVIIKKPLERKWRNKPFESLEDHREFRNSVLNRMGPISDYNKKYIEYYKTINAKKFANVGKFVEQIENQNKNIFQTNSIILANYMESQIFKQKLNQIEYLNFSIENSIYLTIEKGDNGNYITLLVGRGLFGSSYYPFFEFPKTPLTRVDPLNGCTKIQNNEQVSGKVALIQTGDCNFITQVRNAQNAGAVGVIIVDTEMKYHDKKTPYLFVGMGHDDYDEDVFIPSAFIFSQSIQYELAFLHTIYKEVFKGNDEYKVKFKV